MIRDGIHAFKGKRVLLLQGPAGPFFRRLSMDLAAAGAKVFKVNFNGGDLAFYPSEAINYRGRPELWPEFFEELLHRLSIEVVLLFGDCRPVHHVAGEIARRRGLELGVFEEGYVRPSYVTFERYGVNGYSKIPRDPNYYLKEPRLPVDPPFQLGNTFWHMALWFCCYYLAAALFAPMFRHYVHHRPLTIMESIPWLLSIWRKMRFAIKERGVAGRLAGPLSKKYFLVPLQVHNDAQIHTHSAYDGVAHFFCDVIKSFAKHAPKSTVLVIKHHPMDRAYFDYTRFIKEMAVKYAVRERCLYIHDQHLPTLLKHTRGVIVVNSTVGLSALYHGAPVKVCGKAIYDMRGLTYQGALDRFWVKAPQSGPRKALFERFRSYLIWQTQLNGSFYKRLPMPGMRAGLHWTSRKVNAVPHKAPNSLCDIVGMDGKRVDVRSLRTSA